jgi:hypothetical protein
MELDRIKVIVRSDADEFEDRVNEFVSQKYVRIITMSYRHNDYGHSCFIHYKDLSDTWLANPNRDLEDSRDTVKKPRLTSGTFKG